LATVETKAVRADAQRNRERLVEAARRAFASGEHKATLEGIARDAGVGIGTLYRHFPTREALVEAVYRAELARLCDSAAELLADLEPDAALRAWMDRFAGYVAAKRDMADTLRVIVAAGTITTSQARERLAASVQVLLDAGVAAGTLRDDVLAQDVVVSLVGIFLACGPGQSEQAGRMMDLLMAGLRRQLAADPAVPGPAAS
jgi:AcrR family transcriptional regulator